MIELLPRDVCNVLVNDKHLSLGRAFSPHKGVIIITLSASLEVTVAFCCCCPAGFYRPLRDGEFSKLVMLYLTGSGATSKVWIKRNEELT